MTKGTKAFRIIICILLGLTMLWTAYISYAFIYYATDEVHNERYGLYVGGVDVTYANAGDILGDGTAYYDAKANKLTLKNANIEYDYAIIYSEIDLLIELVGENKLVFKDKESGTAIYASNDILRKDLSFFGDGSLEIAFENVSASGTGIVADDLWIGADVTVTTPNSSNISNGIICTSSLNLRNNANVTVNNGAARSSTAVSVRGNAVLESGTALNVTVAPGATDACNGVCVDGNLIVGKGVLLNVAIDDEGAQSSACIDVLGVMSAGRDAVVTASAKNVTDIECGGAFIHYGAAVNAEIDALGGIHDKSEN